jgi:hypothetical protein
MRESVCRRCAYWSCNRAHAVPLTGVLYHQSTLSPPPHHSSSLNSELRIVTRFSNSLLLCLRSTELRLLVRQTAFHTLCLRLLNPERTDPREQERGCAPFFVGHAVDKGSLFMTQEGKLWVIMTQSPLKSLSLTLSLTARTAAEPRQTREQRLLQNKYAVGQAVGGGMVGGTVGAPARHRPSRIFASSAMLNFLRDRPHSSRGSFKCLLLQSVKGSAAFFACAPLAVPLPGISLFSFYPSTPLWKFQGTEVHLMILVLDEEWIFEIPPRSKVRRGLPAVTRSAWFQIHT